MSILHRKSLTIAAFAALACADLQAQWVYASAYRPSLNGYGLFVGETQSQVVTRWHGLYAQGLRMTDINSYLNFVLKLFFAFGLAFEIPIAVMLLCWGGVTTPESLREKRPYIVVGAFVVGMMLTPPDIISQTMLAIPMLLLFEGGLFFAKMYTPKDDDEAEEASQ